MLIMFDKSKMVASKMAAYSLNWFYFNYDTTQKVGVLGYGPVDSMDSVKLPSDNSFSLIQDGGIQNGVLLLLL